MANRQHVLVVEDELMGELVKSLLSQAQDLYVTGCAPRDEETLVAEIERTRPAVVVLNEATQLTGLESLLSRLNAKFNLRVMIVSADDNTVRVRSERQIVIARGEDLAATIRDLTLA